MTQSKDPNDPHHHKDNCYGRHRKGRWCWTHAEIQSLQDQADVPHPVWRTISESFTINGFVRHNAYDCFKKWTEEFRDPNIQAPANSTTPQQNTQP